MTEYQLIIYATKENMRKGVKLFERVFSLPSQVEPDWSTLTKAMRQLYGNFVIIQFNIYNIV